MRIDGDAVCEACTCEARGCVGGREDYGPAPAAVNVQPDVVGAADGRERGEGVEGAVHGGAGCGVEEEGRFTFGFGGEHEGLEFRGDDAPAGVDGDGDHARCAEAVEIGGFFDAVVAVGGCEDFQIQVAVAVGFG